MNRIKIFRFNNKTKKEIPYTGPEIFKAKDELVQAKQNLDYADNEHVDKAINQIITAEMRFRECLAEFRKAE